MALLLGLFAAGVIGLCVSIRFYIQPLCTVTESPPKFEAEPSHDGRHPRNQRGLSLIQLKHSVGSAERTDIESPRSTNSPSSWLKSFWCDTKAGDAALVLFTYCLVIVGAFQAFWLWKTVRATRDSVNAFIDGDRAHMFYDGAEPLSDSTWKNNPEVRFDFRNHGKTSAILIKVGLRLFVARELPTKPDYGELENIDYRPPIAPGQAYWNQAKLMPNPILSQEDANKIDAGETYLRAICFIEYADIYGRTHQNRSAWRYDVAARRWRYDAPPQYRENS
jgi:hypothetical protein